MFWQKFISLCSEKGLSPSSVVSELGIASGSVTKWKNGATPRDTTIRRISEYFNVSVEYLYGDTDDAHHFGRRSHIDLFRGADPGELYERQKKAARHGVLIPVLGNVAAGIPLDAITDVEDYEEISEAMAAGGEYVALRIHGDSMEPRMQEGDVVIVRVQDTAESGDTAVVIVNGGEATCKKIKKTPEGLMLIALNPDYEPMFFSRKEVEELPVRIFGKVVELRAKFW